MASVNRGGAHSLCSSLLSPGQQGWPGIGPLPPAGGLKQRSTGDQALEWPGCVQAPLSGWAHQRRLRGGTTSLRRPKPVRKMSYSKIATMGGKSGAWGVQLRDYRTAGDSPAVVTVSLTLWRYLPDGP